jgi:hypothetical protein
MLRTRKKTIDYRNATPDYEKKLKRAETIEFVYQAHRCEHVAKLEVKVKKVTRIDARFVDQRIAPAPGTDEYKQIFKDGKTLLAIELGRILSYQRAQYKQPPKEVRTRSGRLSRPTRPEVCEHRNETSFEAGKGGDVREAIIDGAKAICERTPPNRDERAEARSNQQETLERFRQASDEVIDDVARRLAAGADAEDVPGPVDLSFPAMVRSLQAYMPAPHLPRPQPPRPPAS